MDRALVSAVVATPAVVPDPAPVVVPAPVAVEEAPRLSERRGVVFAVCRHTVVPQTQSTQYREQFPERC